MNYDQFITRGIDNTHGVFLWDVLKTKNPTHHDILQKMRETQETLAAYAKHNKMDGIQRDMVRDIQFLETMAWRVYMFGQRFMFSINPGNAGEYAKRMRTDSKFHKMLELYKMRMGPVGCAYPQMIFWPAMKCFAPKCKHSGARYAVKKLKSDMRREWDTEILNRYKY